MRKYLLILFLLVFIVPSVASASWWNPFSWKVFQKKEVTPQMQVEKQKTPEEKISDLQKQLDDLKKEQPSFTSATTIPVVKKEVKKATPVVDNSAVIKAEAQAKAKMEQDALLAKQKAEEEAKKKEEDASAYKTNCENLLNKYNADLFKYKEGYGAQLKQISDGMEKAKANYKQRLTNAYGNQPLWDSIMAEMDDNVAGWGVVQQQVSDYWDAKKSEIDRLPLCPNY